MAQQRLSMRQVEAMVGLAHATDPYDKCAYSLRTSLATLDALVSKGLAVCTTAGAFGTMFFPRTELHYDLTDAGRQWLLEYQGCA